MKTSTNIDNDDQLIPHHNRQLRPTNQFFLFIPDKQWS